MEDQWYVFRANHLIIVTGDTGPGAFALAEAVAATIAAHLPESKAMAARAQTPVDVVMLLQSNQLQVALLSADDAVEASSGGGRFKEDGPVRFRTLAVFFLPADAHPIAYAHIVVRTFRWRRALHGGGR